MQALAWEWLPEQPSSFMEGLETAPVRVLLAEDDDELRELLAAALRGEGYVVVEAADGEHLTELVSSQMVSAADGPGLVDLIVSDIRMPGPSGLWALETLRHMDWATPFVVITAHADPETRARARALGASAVLSKPLDLKRFRAVVANLAGPATMVSPGGEGDTLVRF